MECCMLIIIACPTERLKSGGKPVLNTCDSNDNSTCDYPESVVLKSSAKSRTTDSG